MPTCPKCQNWISESRYQRHLERCGATQRHEPQSLIVPSTSPQVENPDRGITYGPASEQRGGINWTKVMAAFVIFLLVGSVAVFFVLYVLSLL